MATRLSIQEPINPMQRTGANAPVADLYRWAMKSCIAAVVTLACVSQLFGANAGKVAYDYSSPAASFRSFQEAIRRDDFPGVVTNVWEISQRMKEETRFTGKRYGEVLADVKGRARSSMLLVDSSPIEGGLKVSEAKFVREEAREHGKLESRVTVCRMLIEWPEKHRQAHVEAYNFDGTKEWWFWPTFYYPVKTFEATDDAKDKSPTRR
jgi:hypothetical protein